MRLRSALSLALTLPLLVASGCGETKTRTVTVTKTETETQTVIAPATGVRADPARDRIRKGSEFCASPDGRAIEDAGVRARDALDEDDSALLRRQTARALAAAEEAPAGATCAIAALNNLAGFWPQVAPGSEAAEQVARIRKVQDERDLRSVLP